MLAAAVCTETGPVEAGPGACPLPSTPAKLRRLYRLADSWVPTCTRVLSALLARLCPGLPVGVRLLSPSDVSWVEFVGVLAIDECWVAVGVEPPVEMLADESVLAAARL